MEAWPPVVIIVPKGAPIPEGGEEKDTICTHFGTHPYIKKNLNVQSMNETACVAYHDSFALYAVPFKALEGQKKHMTVSSYRWKDNRWSDGEPFNPDKQKENTKKYEEGKFNMPMNYTWYLDYLKVQNSWGWVDFMSAKPINKKFPDINISYMPQMYIDFRVVHGLFHRVTTFDDLFSRGWIYQETAFCEIDPNSLEKGITEIFDGIKNEPYSMERIIPYIRNLSLWAWRRSALQHVTAGLSEGDVPKDLVQAFMSLMYTQCVEPDKEAFLQLIEKMKPHLGSIKNVFCTELGKIPSSLITEAATAASVLDAFTSLDLTFDNDCGHAILGVIARINDIHGFNCANLTLPAGADIENLDVIKNLVLECQKILQCCWMSIIAAPGWKEVLPEHAVASRDGGTAQFAFYLPTKRVISGLEYGGLTPEFVSEVAKGQSRFIYQIAGEKGSDTGTILNQETWDNFIGEVVKLKVQDKEIKMITAKQAKNTTEQMQLKEEDLSRNKLEANVLDVKLQEAKNEYQKRQLVVRLLPKKEVIGETNVNFKVKWNRFNIPPAVKRTKSKSKSFELRAERSTTVDRNMTNAADSSLLSFANIGAIMEELHKEIRNLEQEKDMLIVAHQKERMSFGTEIRKLRLLLVELNNDDSSTRSASGDAASTNSEARRSVRNGNLHWC